jgi:ankyrin repeat protein
MNMTSISSETRTPGQLTDDSTFQVARRHQRRDQRDIHYWLHDSMHLVTAAAERDEAMLIELLDGFVDVNAKPNGWTALCTAIHAGHTDVARLLLKNGAHPEIKMDVEYNGIPRGATALYCAAACGHLEIVRLLVMAGANLNVHVPHSKGSRIGTNPLNAAAGRDHLGVVEYLLEAGADRFSEEWLPGWDAFTWACHEGATTVIAYFLDKKNFPVDWNDRTGLTPLQWALRGGQITVIGILSSKGAVFSAQDDKVSTPLHKAGQNDLRRSHLQGPGYPSAVTDGGPKNALDLAKEPSTEAVREITTLLESGSPDVEVMFSV